MAEILYKQLSYAITGAAMEVHSILGPGFLESVYQIALEKELHLREIPFERKVKLPVSYKGDLIGEYEADLIVDGKIILELKSVSRITPAHESQAHHYLAATGLHLAIVINLGETSLQSRRVIRTTK